MPVVSRVQLRQHLGQLKLRDTYVGTVTVSCAAGASAFILDAAIANVAFSGEAMNARTWVRVLANASTTMDFRVATFNTGSGAYQTLQNATAAIQAGVQYEHHRKTSAAEKDRCIDGIVGRLWTRQEVPIATIQGALVYSLGLGYKIFGVKYFAQPDGSLDRAPGQLLPGWNIVLTGSGTRELRLPEGGALGASQQIILDAQVRASLGSADTATVNIPDEDWVLDGAAARCYQGLWADAPGKEAGKYQALATAHAKLFIDNIGRFRDQIMYGHRGDFDQVVPN